MKQTISKGEFRDAFFHMKRNDNFSYEALGALYDYLEDLDEDYELDVIALCCEFTEDTIENTLKEYRLKSLEELQENTVVVWDEGTRVLFLRY